MPDQPEPRVAVYIDFDNIVISRYDQVHGKAQWGRDRARSATSGAIADRLEEARVEVGAILDYASSFGTIVVSRAYADWSAPANSRYRQQLVDRAVDLTQLFPVSGAMKNGADIRLSVDVIEDLFRLPDVTHVLIVAGDSDYIALAQRARRLGRHVVGIGVAGSTSRSLMAACDEFADYDDLRGLEGGDDDDDEEPDAAETVAVEVAEAAAGDDAPADTGPPSSGRPAQRAATKLLMRAMRLIRDKRPDDEWMSLGEVKNQMTRMDPAFSEKPLGFGSFSDFVADRPSQVEMSKAGSRGERRIKLRRGQ